MATTSTYKKVSFKGLSRAKAHRVPVVLDRVTRSTMGPEAEHTFSIFLVEDGVKETHLLFNRDEATALVNLLSEKLHKAQ